MEDRKVLYIYIYIYIYGCCRSKERIRIYFRISKSTKRFVFFEFIHFLKLFCSYIRVIYMYVSSMLLSSENMWHKAFLMGYSMRLELTLVSGVNKFILEFTQ